MAVPRHLLLVVSLAVPRTSIPAGAAERIGELRGYPCSEAAAIHRTEASGWACSLGHVVRGDLQANQGRRAPGP